MFKVLMTALRSHKHSLRDVEVCAIHGVVDTHMYTYARIHIHTHTYTYTHAYTYMHIYMQTHMFTNAQLLFINVPWMCLHIHIHMHTHEHMRAHT